MDYIYPAYFGEKVTNNELAYKYGFSQSYVNRILNKAKNDFKDYLSE